MKRFFSRNIGYQGRLVRGVLGALLLIAGILLAHGPPWVRLLLAGSGALGIFEAVRGWCLARACGLWPRQ
jgi:hypothetical protein